MLFTPFMLGDLPLANRIVMAPLTRSRADTMGVPLPHVVDYYTQRASAGLIIAEGTQPSFAGQGYCRTPGIETADQIAGWKRVTDSVHAAGGKIFLQIMHVGRIGHPLNRQTEAPLVAPSAIAAAGQMYTDQSGMQDHPVPHALETSELPALLAEFVQAARNAVTAGFDGVELHAANGYLLNQFLSSNTNHRTDSYGGSVENRIRFPVEVASAVVAAIGADRVAIRISPGHMFNDLRDDNPVETHLALLAALKPLGLVYTHLMLPDAFDASLNNAGKVEDLIGLFRPLVPRAFMAAGKFTQDTAEAALADGTLDLVAFGRPFIANPDLVERMRTHAPLAEPDPNLFYSPGPHGYSDYPALAKTAA
jgi:N-ethylmaleimide reductase